MSTWESEIRYTMVGTPIPGKNKKIYLNANLTNRGQGLCAENYTMPIKKASVNGEMLHGLENPT